MKKDGLLTGIIVGGVLGITVSVLGMRKLKGMSAKKDSQGENIQLEPLAENEEETGSQEDNSKSESEKDSKSVSEETAEKHANLEEESRDPEREEKMKTKMESSSMMEDIAAKINFSQKISQLEEALKKLREESAQ